MAARVKTSDHRKHIPIGVRLHACLLLLGFTEDEISGGVEWHHDPALCLRVVDKKTGLLVPHPNDPGFIRPMRKADHKVRTFGPGAERRITTRGSDVSEPRRIERMAERHKEFCRTALAPKKRKPAKAKKAGRAWPKRTFARKGQPHG